MDQHKNLAYSVVATAPSPALSGTSLTVAFGQGARFPAAPFNITVWATGEIPIPTNAEILRVTAVVGDVLTIQRAQEGTSARAIVAGDQVAATITAKTFTDIEDAIPSTAGLLSAINISAGAASNNLSALTFSNGGGVSFGLAGSVVTAAVETNYQAPGAYLTTAALSQDSSKYAGTNGAITGGSITVNTAGVSVNLPAYLTTAALSQDSSKYAGTNGAITGGSITVNTAGVSVNLPAYLTTAMQSDAVTLSNIKVSAGASTANLSALTFSNSNGLAFGLNAGTITGSYTVPTQTVQTQNLIAASLSGNTAGVLALVSSGTAYFAGGNNITLSQNGQSITISGANAGGVQTGISGVVVSDATYTSGTVSFSGNNITIASSVNGATQYIKLSGNAAQTNQSAIKAFGVSNTGQTAGNTGVSTGIDWVLAGSGSITLSQSTAGGGPNTVWMQHPAWLTTAALSADSSKYAGTNGAITGGSITVNTSGVSINLPAYISTQSTQFLALTLGGNSAGTSTFHATNNASLFFNGGNNITLSGNGSTVTIIGPNTAAQTTQSAIKAFGVSNTGQTAGNTGVSTGIDWVMAGSGSITLSQSTAGGGPNTVWIQHPAWLTTARGSTDGIGLNTAKTNVTWTVNSSGLSFDAGGYAGTGYTSTTTAGTAIVGTHNTAGLSLGVPAFLTTAALSGDSSKYAQAWELTGNTSGTTSSAQGTKWYLSGGANLTISGNSNTIVFSAGTAAPSPVNFSAGTTSGNLGSVVFSNSNGVSFGLNGSTITATVSTYDTVGTATSGYPVASANSIGTVTRWAAEDHRHAGIGAIGISTGNTLGTSGSVQGSYWVAGSNNVSVSQITSNNGSHTLVVQGQPPLSYWKNAAAENLAQTQTLSVQASTSYIQPLILDKDISVSYARFLNSFAVTNTTTIATTANATGSCSILSTLFLMLYTKGVGASSNSLQSYLSSSVGLTQVWSLSANANGSQWTLSQSMTHPITGGTSQFTTGVTTSLSNYSLGSLSLTRFTGLQHLDIPLATLLTAGNYWLMVGASSTTSTGGSGGAFTQLRLSNSLIAMSQINSAIPLMGNVAAASIQYALGHGSVSTNAINTTASLDFSNISSSASHPILPIQLMRIT